MTPQEVAAYLEVGRSTVKRLVDEGVLQPVKYNPLLKRQRNQRFYRDDVIALKANPPARPRGPKPRSH